MSRTRSTALERSVIPLLGGLNRFYGIPTLTLGPDTVHITLTSAQTSDDNKIIHKIHNHIWNRLSDQLWSVWPVSSWDLISVTAPNLRPVLKPFLRLNPHMVHCPLYTVYCDHCHYDVWTTVQRLLREIHRTAATQAVLVFCYPFHLTLSIYRVRTAFNTWPKVPSVCWIFLLLHSLFLLIWLLR